MWNIPFRSPESGESAVGLPPLTARPRSETRSPDDLALDWQIVLGLRALIERRPETTMDLLADGASDPGYLALIYAAAREAVNALPDQADVQFALAAAALCTGRRGEAQSAVARCLQLAPQHARAAALQGRLRAKPTERTRH